MQAAHGPDNNAVFASRALDGNIRETSPRICNEMHPLIRRLDRQFGAEAALEGGHVLPSARPAIGTIPGSASEIALPSP